MKGRGKDASAKSSHKQEQKLKAKSDYLSEKAEVRSHYPPHLLHRFTSHLFH